MQQVEVKVVPPYAALIEAGLIARLGAPLGAALAGRGSLFVVTAPPIREHWAAPLSAALDAAGLRHEVLEIRDGERYKTLATVGDLAARLVRRGADRRSALLALGGGVVGDVTGFTAAIYMRGIPVVQIPTTLLAQVDASVGGKTGVDLRAGKNLVGVFHQPRAVFIDPVTLTTLPEREYRSGLFEALKCGIIANPAIFRFMEEQREKILARDAVALEWLIAACVRVKAEVVAVDEHESGLRRILNFGHTIGHALEAETGFKHFLHGEAVAWGMIAAATIAVSTGRADAATARRIASAVLAYAPLPPVEARSARIVRRLSVDKKTLNGVVHFVLPVAIGQVEIISDVPSATVAQAVDELRRLRRS